eukprot:gnl/Chilomastix_cuspidata/4994.p1 GENE.gnl/Chilomastix_cuspidata/4994~~gnl/Chilomastix_cuspidata/4994.p1  ORF type:complete len:3521 (-),score=913.51 gnl/Chilomastix_cuspidata/4994:49-10611(-)
MDSAQVQTAVTELSALIRAEKQIDRSLSATGKQDDSAIHVASCCVDGDFTFQIGGDGRVAVSVSFTLQGEPGRISQEDIKNARAQVQLTTGAVERAARGGYQEQAAGGEKKIEIQKQFLRLCVATDNIISLLESLAVLGHPKYVKGSAPKTKPAWKLDKMRKKLQASKRLYIHIIRDLRASAPQLSVFTGLDLHAICFGEPDNAVSVLKLLGPDVCEDTWAQLLQDIHAMASAPDKKAHNVLSELPAVLGPFLESRGGAAAARKANPKDPFSVFKEPVVIAVERTKTFAAIFALFASVQEHARPSVANTMLAHPGTRKDELSAFVARASSAPAELHVLAFADLLPYALKSKHLRDLLQGSRGHLRLALFVAPEAEKLFRFKKYDLNSCHFSAFPAPRRATLFTSARAGNGKTYQITHGKPPLPYAHLSGILTPESFVDRLSGALEQAAARHALHLEIGRTTDMMQNNPDETNSDKLLKTRKPKDSDRFSDASVLVLLSGLFSILHLGCIRTHGRVFWLPADEADIYIEAATTTNEYLAKMLAEALGFDGSCTVPCDFRWEGLALEDNPRASDYRLCAAAVAHIQRFPADPGSWDLCSADSLSDAQVVALLKGMYTFDVSEYFVEAFPLHLVTFRLVNETVTILTHMLMLLASNSFYTASCFGVMYEGEPRYINSIHNTLLRAFLAEARASSTNSVGQTQGEPGARQRQRVIGWHEMKRFMAIFNPAEPTDAIRYWYPSTGDMQGSRSFRFPPDLEEVFKGQDPGGWAPTRFDQLSDAKIRERLHNVFCVSKDRDFKSLDPSFCLTADNCFKILLMFQRMQNGLPVILQGEAGVGKTRLIRFLAGILSRSSCCRSCELVSLTMNEGTQFEMLLDIVGVANTLAGQGVEVILFLDELNASPHVDEITHLLFERSIRGVVLQPDVKLFAALNPRRTVDERIYRESESSEVVGLNSRLVYRVYEALPRLLQEAIDFGELRPEDEWSYIRAICASAPELLDLRLGASFTNCLAETIIACHAFLHSATLDASWTCSLRDTRRAVRFFAFFIEHQDLFMRSRTRRRTLGRRSVNNPLLLALVLSVHVAYVVRLPKTELRRELIGRVSHVLRKHRLMLDLWRFVRTNIFEDIVNYAQRELLKLLDTPQGIAHSKALGENTLVLFAGICTRTPVIIVGPPGTSKSLALSLIISLFDKGSDGFHGGKPLPRVMLLSYQGSETATSEGILTVANNVNEYVSEEDVDAGEAVSLFVFDELGLAQRAPANPLKVLHDLLEPTGCYKRPLKRSPKNAAAEVPPYAFVGLSNHILDAAPSSRSVILFRPSPDAEEIAGILRELYQQSCTYETDFEAELVAKRATRAHLLVKEYAQKRSRTQWVGTRDVYSLVKIIANKWSRNSADNKRCLLNAVCRCYGGVGDSLMQIVSVFFNVFKFGVPFWFPSPIDLFRQNISDRSPAARHLCTICDPAVVIALADSLARDTRPVRILKGSTYPNDQNNGDFTHQILCSLINAANNGHVVFLVGLRHILGACFDLLNRCYLRSVEGYGLCRIALGAASSPLCRVSDEHRVIISLTCSEAKGEEEALMQRLEKVTLSTQDLFRSDTDMRNAYPIFAEAAELLGLNELAFFSPKSLVADILVRAAQISKANFAEEAVCAFVRLVPLSSALKYYNEHREDIGNFTEPEGVWILTFDAIVTRIMARCIAGKGAFPDLLHSVEVAVEAARSEQRCVSSITLVQSNLFSGFTYGDVGTQIAQRLDTRVLTDTGVGSASSKQELQEHFSKLIEGAHDDEEVILLVDLNGAVLAHFDSVLHVLTEVLTFARKARRVHAFIVVSTPQEGVSASALSGWECAVVDSALVPPHITSVLCKASGASFIETLVRLPLAEMFTREFVENNMGVSIYLLRFPSKGDLARAFRGVQTLYKSEHSLSVTHDVVMKTLQDEPCMDNTRQSHWLEACLKTSSSVTSLLSKLLDLLENRCQRACVAVLGSLIENDVLTVPSSAKHKLLPQRLNRLSYELWRDIVTSTYGDFYATKQKFLGEFDRAFSLSEVAHFRLDTIEVSPPRPDAFCGAPYEIFIRSAVEGVRNILRSTEEFSFFHDRRKRGEGVRRLIRECLCDKAGTPKICEFLDSFFELDQGAPAVRTFVSVLNSLARTPHLSPEIWRTLASGPGEALAPDGLFASFLEGDPHGKSSFFEKASLYKRLQPVACEEHAVAVCRADSAEFTQAAVSLLMHCLGVPDATPLPAQAQPGRSPSPPVAPVAYKTWVRAAHKVIEIHKTFLDAKYAEDIPGVDERDEMAIAFLEYCIGALEFLAAPAPLLQHACALQRWLSASASLADGPPPQVCCPHFSEQELSNQKALSEYEDVLLPFYRQMFELVPVRTAIRIYCELPTALALPVTPLLVDHVGRAMLGACSDGSFEFFNRVFGDSANCDSAFTGAAFAEFNSLVECEFLNSLKTNTVSPVVAALHQHIAQDIIPHMRRACSDSYAELQGSAYSHFHAFFVFEVLELPNEVFQRALALLNVNAGHDLPPGISWISVIAANALLFKVSAIAALKLLQRQRLTEIEEFLVAQLAILDTSTLLCGPVASVVRHGVMLSSSQQFENAILQHRHYSEGAAVLSKFYLTNPMEHAKPGAADFLTPQTKAALLKLGRGVRINAGDRVDEVLCAAALLSPAAKGKLNIEHAAAAPLANKLVKEQLCPHFRSAGALHCVAQVWGAALCRGASAGGAWLQDLLVAPIGKIDSNNAFIPTMWPLRELCNQVAAAVGDENRGTDIVRNQFDGAITLYRCSRGHLCNVANCGAAPRLSEYSDLPSHLRGQLFSGTDKCPICAEKGESNPLTCLGSPRCNNFKNKVRPFVEGGIIPAFRNVFRGRCSGTKAAVAANALETDLSRSSGGLLLHFIANAALAGRFLLSGRLHPKADFQRIKGVVGPDPDEYFLEQAADSFGALHTMLGGESESITPRVSRLVAAALRAPQLWRTMPHSHGERTRYEKELVEAFNGAAQAPAPPAPPADTHASSARQNAMRCLFFQKPVDVGEISAAAYISAVLCELQTPLTRASVRNASCLNDAAAARFPAAHLFLKTNEQDAVELAALPYIARMAALGRRLCVNLTPQELAELTIRQILRDPSGVAQRMATTPADIERTLTCGLRAWQLAMPRELRNGCQIVPMELFEDASVVCLCPDKQDAGLPIRRGLKRLIKLHNKFHRALPATLRDPDDACGKDAAPAETPVFDLEPRHAFFMRVGMAHRVVDAATIAAQPVIALAPRTVASEHMPAPAARRLLLAPLDASVRDLFARRRAVRKLRADEGRFPMPESYSIEIVSDEEEEVEAALRRVDRRELYRAVPPERAARVLGELCLLLNARHKLQNAGMSEAGSVAATVGSVADAAWITHACTTALSVRAIAAKPAAHLYAMCVLVEARVPAAAVRAKLPHELTVPLPAAALGELVALELQLPRAAQQALARALRAIVFRLLPRTANSSCPLQVWLENAFELLGLESPPTFPNTVQLAHIAAVIDWVDDKLHRKRR